MGFRSDMPIYLQISMQLKEKILNGEYNNDDKLPSVRELSVIYEVTALTIQRALAQLELEGVIYSKKGVGSFVKPGCHLHLEQQMVIEKTKEYVNNMKNLGLRDNDIFELIKGVIKNE
ncbi:GntR family transcriptional regulator [Lachnoclostridium phytofermentans]|uniref:Transcriptional regulator, GntR family n=1 Tax=Lachnoclostridium phytofermentans (strain ATCC 700394 / DSM 18823 / ISDg) TaxID=357809 RepID=A9KK28_LACP7|nr:GntR family transcriptional regulator [Lachnoclostridium phytofermentans]ABX42600.1 transcriptional regulator, GntR family [Lachnoclostridium phytofermentans ISDg]